MLATAVTIGKRSLIGSTSHEYRRARGVRGFLTDPWAVASSMHADRAGRAAIVPLQREGEAEHQRRAHGQQPKGVEHAPSVPYAYVADPEGYVIESEMPARTRRTRSNGARASRH